MAVRRHRAARPLPISIWHERAWRGLWPSMARPRGGRGYRSVAARGNVDVNRRAAGALLTVGALFALMTALGIAACGSGPGASVLHGGAQLLRPSLRPVHGRRRYRRCGGAGRSASTWRGRSGLVARKVRRSTHARPETRGRLFAEAIAVDPGVARGREAARVSAEQSAEEPEETTD